MATTATNISEARKNLKKLTDDVVDYDDQVIITKPKNRNVVIMSEKEYQSWKETMYLLGTEANRKNLDESIGQLNNSKIKTLSKEEWDKLSDED
ncbi:type II toxin-antitoxin system Phd/YefM family antitoxin [Companilactobacillus zhongbaensis]|uniref:type II toxin-antitoxin system Phd/YefM family antitoxin n=1 Tax=Companilactobacillus zhongbaensis TaxID=2486009 RepID=UPI000F7B31D7|nr:type II toxin-antitoxin system prevent-host-death family antitoxin [Companilactobacillus zhongbaensis]